MIVFLGGSVSTHSAIGYVNLSCFIAAPLLAPLVYESDNSTQVRLRDYVVSHVFTDLNDDEPEDEDGKHGYSFLSFISDRLIKLCEMF